MKTFFYNMETRIDNLAASVVQLLSVRCFTLATAESCTGGLLAGALTSAGGASEVFGLGYVTYGNEFKISELGVDAAVLDEYGAVSEITARQMALGAKTKAGADIALSVTGIAGPGGGTEEKPVGTVFFNCTVTDGERRRESCLQLKINAKCIPPDFRRKYIRLESVRQALILAADTLTE